jgi:peptide/nickel transport system permease protein
MVVRAPRHERAQATPVLADESAQHLPARRQSQGPWAIALRRIRRSPHVMIGGGVLAALVLLAVFAPVVAPADPNLMDIANQFQPPSWRHPMGTDEFGRDILSRVIFGGQLSLQVGVLATLFALCVGTALGLVAGFRGGWVDLIIQRSVEIMMAFPGLVLALAIIAVLGPGLQNVMLALAVGGVPYYVRLVRAQVLSIRTREYVEAATVSGAGSGRIMVRHVLPGTISPLLVIGSLDLAGNILAAAGLSFIGLGAQPPSPEWGAMLASGRVYMRDQWWMTTFPGLAIMLAVLALNLLGDGLRDVFDPQGLD